MLIKRYIKPALFLLVIASFIMAACTSPAPEPTQVVEATSAPVEVEPTAVPEATKAPQSTKAPEPTLAKPTEAPPAEKKIATFIWTQEFDTLNPFYTNMWFSSVTQQIWNCWAWNFDENSQSVPLLVTEIPSKDNGGISEDNKTITLKLRDDIQWSDGTPITATDFIFTFEMNMNPANTVAGTNPYDLMDSVTAADDQTVVITFKDPYAPWLARLYRGLLPAHVLQPVFDADGTLDNAEWNRAPTVGCGPYVFAEWESGSFTRFVANENYWLGQPKIDEIFFRFVPDDASQVAALKNKEGDLGTFVSYSDIPDLEAVGLKTSKVSSGYGEGIYFNLTDTGHPALQDVRVRQAIAFATDRDSLVKDLLLGLTAPAATYWDLSPFSHPDNKPYPFDPEKAKGLLDEAGWIDSNGDGTRDKDGEELALNYGTTTREIRKDTQAVLQQQLADVGIKVELLNYDSDQFFADKQNNGPTYTGELDMWEYSGSPNFPDPDVIEWLCSEVPTDNNPGGVNAVGCIPELDALFQKQSQQVDLAERTATFHELTKMMVDQMYWLGLWQDPDIWVVSDKLQNVKLSGTTPFFNILEWDFVQ